MTKYVIGNWKSNLDISESQTLASSIIGSDSVEVVICPPFTSLTIQISNGVILGAQNCSQFGEGAYTGEITAKMLKNLGCQYVIVGHSERRTHFVETDKAIKQKALKALENNLIPVICVGENLEEYESGKADEVVRNQMYHYKDLAAELIIAYEPIWAIGTGKVPTNDEIRSRVQLIKDIVDAPVLYGGSVNDKNATELADIEGLDGFLVGGASLKTNQFNNIISAI